MRSLWLLLRYKQLVSLINLLVEIIYIVKKSLDIDNIFINNHTCNLTSEWISQCLLNDWIYCVSNNVSALIWICRLAELVYLFNTDLWWSNVDWILRLSLGLSLSLNWSGWNWHLLLWHWHWSVLHHWWELLIHVSSTNWHWLLLLWLAGSTLHHVSTALVVVPGTTSSSSEVLLTSILIMLIWDRLRTSLHLSLSLIIIPCTHLSLLVITWLASILLVWMCIWLIISKTKNTHNYFLIPNFTYFQILENRSDSSSISFYFFSYSLSCLLNQKSTLIGFPKSLLSWKIWIEAFAFSTVSNKIYAF